MEINMIIDILKKYIAGECKKTGNALGPSFFDHHILKVVEYSKLLADSLAADSEVVEIAAYLHDIAAVQNIKALPEHHILSAVIAGNMLHGYNFSNERIERVVQAIKKHVNPVQVGEASLEDVCLSNADAMSQIAEPVYWLYFAYSVRRLSFEQGKEWYQKRIENNWKALIPQAKEIIEKEYHYTRRILTNGKSATLLEMVD